MTHVLPDGKRKVIATGYSGFGSALDDPTAQDRGNAGPIPRGSWTIGPLQDHELRKDFWIHGDTAAHNHTASTGCIVLPRDARQAIAGSGDNELQVVHP